MGHGEKAVAERMAVLWEVQDEAERVLRERRAFRARLRTLPTPRCDEDAAELIYGELVANTVRHANGCVLARLEIDDGEPVLVVRDQGPGLRDVPRRFRSDPYAESGRGLALVEMLARDVEIEARPGEGTEIRAVLPVAGAREPAFRS
jgi:anti-sigma regulatory factor (Ser/Thr protein kinase)